MQMHLAAIGYFLLSVLCLHVGSHYDARPSILPLVLNVSSLVALLLGIIFFVTGSLTYVNAALSALRRLAAEAQIPPARDSRSIAE